jgi:4-amino-4-deoxy-L-arabinose transferase-like glycosyltransferase
MTALAVLLLALHATLAWLARAPGMLTRQDDARYLTLARALSQGSYRDLMWPDAPVHHMYPPGYPALLAMWRAIGGEGFDWMVTLQIILSVVTMLLLYDVMRRRVPPVVTIATLAICAVNPSLVEWAGQIASEPALMLTIMLAVWASVAMQPGWKQGAVMLAAALAAPNMRAAGMVIPVALLLNYFQRREWRQALWSLAIAVPVLGVLLWWTLNDPHPIVGSSYAADMVSPSLPDASLLKSLILRLRDNLFYYSMRGLPWLVPTPSVPGTVVDNAIMLVVIVLTLVAGVAGAFRRVSLAAWCVLTMGALLAIWTWQVGRFLVPILPLILLLMVLGAWRLGNLRSVRWAVGAPVALGVSILLGATVRTRAEVVRHISCVRTDAFPDARCVTEDQATFFQAARFIRDSLPSEARLLSAKSEPLYWYTGHTTVPYQRYEPADDARLAGFLAEQKVEYVLLGNLQNLEAKRMAPMLARRCAEVGVVGWFPPRTLLLRWTARPGDGTNGCELIARYNADTVVRAVFGKWRQ